MHLITTIEDPAVIQRILAHLGLPGTRDGPQPPCSMTAAVGARSTLRGVTVQASQGPGPPRASARRLSTLILRTLAPLAPVPVWCSRCALAASARGEPNVCWRWARARAWAQAGH